MISVEEVLSVHVLLERVEPALTAIGDSVVDLHNTVDVARRWRAALKSLCDVYAVNHT